VIEEAIRQENKVYYTNPVELPLNKKEWKKAIRTQEYEKFTN